MFLSVAMDHLHWNHQGYLFNLPNPKVFIKVQVSDIKYIHDVVKPPHYLIPELFYHSKHKLYTH